MARILILDDMEGRHAVFRLRLPDDERVHCYGAAEAIAALGGDRFDLVYLDHDLGATEETGLVVARAIAELPRERRPGRVIVHAHNPRGAEAMRDSILAAGIDCVIDPFSALRK